MEFNIPLSKDNTMVSSHQVASKERLGKRAQTMNLFRNSTSMGALNNQKQMQN